MLEVAGAVVDAADAEGDGRPWESIGLRHPLHARAVARANVAIPSDFLRIVDANRLGMPPAHTTKSGCSHSDRMATARHVQQNMRGNVYLFASLRSSSL